MKIKIGLESVKIDTRGLCGKIMNDHRFWRFAAAEWYKLYTPYVPMDTGMLSSTVAITPGEIEHTVPYARYQYYGDGFHFSRQQHPRAAARWDEKAAPEQGRRLASTLQSYIDSGRIKFQ